MSRPASLGGAGFPRARLFVVGRVGLAGMLTVSKLPALIRKRGWQTHCAGSGAHGPRMDCWAWVALAPEGDADAGCHHLLIHRNDRTGELVYLRCSQPPIGAVADPG